MASKKNYKAGNGRFRKKNQKKKARFTSCSMFNVQIRPRASLLLFLLGKTTKIHFALTRKKTKYNKNDWCGEFEIDIFWQSETEID